MSTAPVSDPRDDLAGSNIHPVVALPRRGIPALLLAIAALVIAVVLFIFLDARRRAAQEPVTERPASINLPPAPPPLSIPAAPAPVPAPAPPLLIHETNPRPLQVMPQPVAAPLAPPPPVFRPSPRMVDDQMLRRPESAPGSPQAGNSTALVVDLTAGNGAAISAARGDAAAGSAAAENDDEAVRARLIRNRGVIVPQGAIIAATLETSLNSDRPGMARAVVSENVRNFDGSRILIPRGSRLIGEFKADSSPNLRRILVTWDRLIRPDGAAIRLGSPASDAMGGSGIPGSVNSHFLERFASAILQSALAVGVNLASRPRSGSDAVYVGLPYQATGVGQQLLPSSTRPATIKVREGAQIAVFVARDLDFGGAPAVR